IAGRYGLAYPGPGVTRLANKAEVARLIPDYSPRSLIFQPDAVPEADLARLAGDISELVLKPGVSTGGVGTVRLDATDLSATTVRAAIRASALRDAEHQTWLLQERVRGRLISLEGYAVDGKVHVIGYSLRGRIDWTEVSNLYPADGEIASGTRDQCEEAVRALVGRSDFRHGYFHCEFLVDDGRPYFIDGHRGRPGGATVVEQIAQAHGLTAGEILRHALLLPLDPSAAGPPPGFRPLEQTSRRLSFFYGLRHGGQVRSIHLPADFSCTHTQF